MPRGRTWSPMANIWTSLLSRKGAVLFLCLTFSALPLTSSFIEPIAESESTPFSSKGSINFRTSKGVATMLSLESRNSSKGSSGGKRRALLGDSRMALHDDLLSKGYFTSNLHIGTPPAEFALIVDTGSTVTYVPCSTCTHCGRHQDAAFSPSASSTYESIPCTSPLCNAGFCGEKKVCTYKRQYAESSSSSGVLGRDIFGFGEDSRLESPKLLFGCENEEKGDLFWQKADGIMGLGRGPLSVVNQLVQEKRMADTFSLCYGGMDEKGGNMIMGDFEAPKGMVFTGSDPKRSPYYNVVLKQIKVAGKPIPVDQSVFNAKYGTVLDSGTTYAYLPERAFNAFKGAVVAQLKNLKAVAGPDPQYPQDHCFQGAGSDLAKLRDYFPAVEFVFGDAVVALEPENYLFKHTRKEGAYCLGVFQNENDHTTLLGGILVRNMLVKYDRANQKIGFWRTKCTDLWTRLKDANENKNEPPPPPPPPAPVETAPPPPPVQAPVSSPPDVTAVAPITAAHIGSLELNMSVTSNITTFGSLSSVFVKDMARDLELEPHQVRLVGFHEQGTDVNVICAVSPASASSFSSRRVEDIIGRLQQHRVQLSSDLGSYKLEHWRLIPEKSSSWQSSYGVAAGVVIIVAIVCAVIAGIWYWRRSRDRPQRLRYTAIDPAGL